MRDISVRLEELNEKLADPKVLSNKGLGNEVGFYIFDYEPEDELIVRNAIPYIKKHIQSQDNTVKIQEFDLYDIVLEFFHQRGFMDKNFKMEEKKGSEFLYDKMKKALKLATDNDWVVNYIREHMDEEAMIFLTGVGKAYPVIRSHTILNNLQTVVEKKPLILFYPGRYDNGSLRLFSRFLDDNYYRAFKLIEN
ncbi:DUF1788 domain-containing protein [Alkalibacterium olivapovliticus]|uniref:Uncharacterized protein DUF1788 n=1 Tax=Alkalibacterium olivapovliticus TaxID=99907 RepID=A0A2T0WCL3_9LACT|nr:DUF1788 domain-containing protein [Alkalibacterium olivapovliticus]PRY84274.1 uncharacterized protein DUF1788 [Alkalibacterium olivapovliticus]